MSPLLVLLVCGLWLVVALVLYAIYVRLGEIHELLAGLMQQSTAPAPPPSPARTIVWEAQPSGSEPPEPHEAPASRPAIASYRAPSAGPAPARPEEPSLRLATTFMQPQAKQAKHDSTHTLIAGILLVVFLLLLFVIIASR